MEQVDTQALKRKLAEWRFGKDGVEYGNTYMGELVIYRRTRWIKEDEEWDIEVLEDFPNSLDACFKWLVPKLNKDGWDVSLEQELGNWLCTLITQKEPYIEQYGKAETPVLALCKAIERLIDETSS